MIKLIVRYGHPTDSTAFEEYYITTHIPIVEKMKGHERSELTKFTAAPNGGRPAHYRMAEFWFTTSQAMQATLHSAEGQATAGDLANFATGGVELMVGETME